MKNLSLLVLLLATLSVNAQEYPIAENVKILFETSVESLKYYQEKSPSEINDGQYDESEVVFFSILSSTTDLAAIGIINDDESLNYNLNLALEVATIFSKEQLEAIIAITEESVLQRVHSGILNNQKFFKLALRYKNKEINVKDLRKSLATKK